MEAMPLETICSRLMTVTGAGVVRSLRRTREPVTTISSLAARFGSALGPPGTPVSAPGAGALAVESTLPCVAGLGGVVVAAGGGVVDDASCACAATDTATDALAAKIRALYLNCMFSSPLVCTSLIRVEVAGTYPSTLQKTTF